MVKTRIRFGKKVDLISMSLHLEISNFLRNAIIYHKRMAIQYTDRLPFETRQLTITFPSLIELFFLLFLSIEKAKDTPDLSGFRIPPTANAH